jgi:CheY-like chemotaxis protein
VQQRLDSLARTLVEDNPANLALVQYLLQASGYTTLTAADGREGVEVAQRESPRHRRS